MRKVLALVTVAALLSGCGEVTRVQTVSAAPVKTAVAAAPNWGPDRHFALLGDRPNDVLFVGDSEDQVGRFYHPPPSAFTTRELPPGFEAPYHAESWTTSGTSSPGKDFGVIFFDTKVAMAMFHEEGIALTDVQDTVNQYIREFAQPTQTVPGTKVHYWFWADTTANEILMICAVENRKDARRFDLTVGVGNQVVMEALRMSPAAAIEDRQAVEKGATSPRVNLH